MIEVLFDILAPHNCINCDTEGSLLCADCQMSLIKLPPRCYLCKRMNDDAETCTGCRKKTPLKYLIALTVYDGAAKELIKRLKYGRTRAGADVIASMLAEVYSGEHDIVVHIPTANSRARSRGYDQAELIARSFASRVCLPRVNALIRLGSERQVGQKREVRQAQVKNAFSVRPLPLLQGKKVLLVDDVLTTGATCEAAARALRQSGVKSVSAVVFAAV